MKLFVVLTFAVVAAVGLRAAAAVISKPAIALSGKQSPFLSALERAKPTPSSWKVSWAMLMGGSICVSTLGGVAAGGCCCCMG